jgi:hypothetical protein
MRERRPKMSASGETKIEPIVMPARPELNNIPNWAGFYAHSRAFSGPVKAIARISKPSSMLIVIQIAIAATWKARIGPSRNMSFTSVVSVLMAPPPFVRLFCRLYVEQIN